MSRLVIALCLALAWAPPAAAEPEEPVRRLELAAAPGYSLGMGHGYGGQLSLTHGWPVAVGGGGTLHGDLGLLAGYQREPYGAANGFLGTGVVSGATQRFQLLATAGGSHRLGQRRRLLLAYHLFVGPVRAVLRGHLDNELYGVSGDYAEDAWTLSAGLSLSQGFAVSDRLTLVFQQRGPLPYAPSAVSGYAFVSLGASLLL